MAEEVIITGVGNGTPDFATEKTLSDIRALMSRSFEGMKPEDAQRLAAAIASGDRDIERILKEMKLGDRRSDNRSLTQLEKLNEKIEKQIGVTRNEGDERDKDAKERKTQLGELNRLLGNIKTGVEEEKVDLMEGLKTALEGAGAALGPIGASAARAVTELAAFANAANSFAIEVGQVRYDMANEMRQRGLAAGLSNVETSMNGFAAMVTNASFTQEQATELMRSFSQSVGDIGIDRALGFINELAFEGANGADMMRRFGFEFGQVSNVAGEYLESVRNLGMLDRMNNQQLRSGMEDFMDSVVTTSNVMKVSLEEAASMIANTLNSRDDFVAQMATLAPELRSQVSSIVGQLGASGTIVEEALATYLTTGGGANFERTDIAQTLKGDPVLVELFDMITAAGDTVLAGGSSTDVYAQLGPQFQGFLDSLVGNTSVAAMLADDPNSEMAKTIAQLTRVVPRFSDALEGNRTDTTRISGDDREFAEKAIVEQRGAVALQNMMDQISRSFDYAENLGELNEANIKLINEVERALVPAAALVVPSLAEVTTEVQEQLTNLGTALASGVGFILSAVPSARRQMEEIEARQQAATETVLGNGGTPEEAAAAAAAVRQQEIERMVGDPRDGWFGMETGPAKMAYNEDHVRTALMMGHEAVDYNGETRINSNLLPGYAPDTYMTIPEEDLERLLGEVDTRQNLITSAETNEFVDRSFVNDLMGALVQRDSSDLAELLGGNDTGKAFDITSAQTQAELEFVNNALQQMNAAGALSKADVERMIEAIQNIDTTGVFRRESTEQREKTEIGSLVTALEGLVSTLQQ